MLSDTEYSKEIPKRLYRHPLITGEEGSRKHITYIEPSSFALALAHAVQPANSNAEPLEDLPNSIDALRDGELKKRLQMILPPSSTATSRADIEKAVTAWFDTQARRTGEAYKADAKAASYVIAAIMTVALNVSPIEIAQRLSQDDALRTTFASAVPDLAPMLFNPGQGLPVAPPAGASLGLVDASATDASSPLAATTNSAMNPEDLKKMLSFYQCAESRLSLPIGWAWMANAADTFKKNDTANSLLGSPDQQACQSAINQAMNSGNVALVRSIGQLNLADANFKREYGPSFETDNPLLIFLGWLITVIAAGQGAPFWFSLLQKFVRR